MSKFSKEFKRLREERGLTQLDMAKILDVSRSTMGMYEQGKREPDFEMLEKIADFFNVNLDTLTGRGSTQKEKRQICELIERCYGDKAFEVVQNFLRLDAADRQTVSIMIQSMLATDKYKKAASSARMEA